MIVAIVVPGRSSMTEEPQRRRRRRHAQATLAAGLRAAFEPVLDDAVPDRLAAAGADLTDALVRSLEQMSDAAVSDPRADRGSTVANIDQRIRDRAYRLWIEEGQPEGRADRHWRRLPT